MNVFDFRKPRQPWMVLLFVTAIFLLATTGIVSAQTNASGANYSQDRTTLPQQVNYLHGGMKPPGLIGQARLSRGGPIKGFYQPVSIQGPRGMQFSMAYGSSFLAPAPAPKTVGMLVGNVYRLRVSNLPIIGAEGVELYPTVEVIDRLYAPEGKAVEHPVIVYLALEDLEMALKGKFVTRVIYIEDPNSPMPIVEPAQKFQGYTDVPPSVDPLAAADTMGRPVAIVRIGGRVPIYQNGQLSQEFLFGSPAFIDYNTRIPKTQYPMTGAVQPPAPAKADPANAAPANAVPVNAAPANAAPTGNLNNGDNTDFFNP